MGHVNVTASTVSAGRSVFAEKGVVTELTNLGNGFTFGIFR